MKPSNDIVSYYDALAPSYDENRFGNSYGQYLHHQESLLLKKLLPTADDHVILDFGCGTGRLMNFASHGMDPSNSMLEVAQQKYPDKEFKGGTKVSQYFRTGSLDAVFSMHVFMHLEEQALTDFLDEAYACLKPGGILLLDFPSQKRRKLVNYRATNWHAATNYSLRDIRHMAGDRWSLDSKHGLLFFPIHRFPSSVRRMTVWADSLLCASPLKEYASYMLVSLRKL